ncbi:hypothetical protein [Winogradskyella sp.]|uniref:hypothetical protein n=1 Tax=Winogradskyella sp. TaxID=1883156 RepID=UPI003AB1C51B
MNKFIRKTTFLFSLLIGLILMLISIVILLNSDNHIDYPTAIRKKYKRLDSLKESQKIIIIGGSSSSYSINSELMQNTLQKPIVNTSLAMSLGSQFQLNLVKDYLQKGDIILYIPEYEFYYGNENGDDFLYTTAFYYPNMIKDFTKAQKIKALKQSFRLSIDYLKSLFIKQIKKSSPISLQYNASSYNYLGDNIGLINMDTTLINTETKNRYQKLKTKQVSTVFIQFLKDFNVFCKKKGVKLLVTFPPIEASQYDNRFVNAVQSVENQTGTMYIGNPMESVFTFDYFYDSSYHLNGKGRVVRTDRLIKTLKKAIN